MGFSLRRLPEPEEAEGAGRLAEPPTLRAEEGRDQAEPPEVFNNPELPELLLELEEVFSKPEPLFFLMEPEEVLEPFNRPLVF